MVGKGNRFRRRIAALVFCLGVYSVLGANAFAHDETLVLELKSGRQIQAKLDFPSSMRSSRSPERFPVILVFGGFQKAGEVIKLMRSSGIAPSHALASFDYPFDPPRKLIFPDSLFWIPKLHQMIHETFEGIQLLDERLANHPKIRSSERILLGASLGAPLALGAIDRGARPTHLVMVHGFGEFNSVIAWQFEKSWKRNWGKFSFLAPSASRALSWLLLFRSGIGQAEDWASRLPQGFLVLQIAAREDEFVPRDAIQSLERALRVSRAKVEFRLTSAGHLQPGATQTLLEVQALTQQWLGLDQPGK